MNPEYHSSTIQNALDVLKLFAHDDRLSFAEMQKRLGYNKSTLLRYVSTLEFNGFLRRDGAGLYGLGLTMFTLGHRASVEDHLRSVAMPIMEQLAKRMDATVHLGILYNIEVVIIAKANPQSRLQLVSRVGGTVPAHCTGQGKTLLAYSPDETVRKVIELRGMERFTANTITTFAGLAAELAAIRQRGFTIDYSEHQNGIRCVAVPILGRAGELVAALSVTGLVTDLPDEAALERASKVVVDARDEIREEMQFV